jgi:hypothetical protein
MNRRKTEVASILAKTSKWATLAGDLHSLADDLAKAVALHQAVSLYHCGQELVRDPANADLIAPLEELRVAYERAVGRPIPPRRK